MYQIYPTLLDMFDRYKGSYEFSEAATAKQELLDKINRVPWEEPEPVKIGKALQALLDEGKFHVADWPFDEDFMVHKDYPQIKFRRELLKEMDSLIGSGVRNGFTEGTLDTRYGQVRLYGYYDAIAQDRVIDIKYTKNYDVGKFFNSHQRLVYPHCLNGQGVLVNSFDFICTDNSQAYVETYVWNPERDLPILRASVEEFIEFIEANKSLITDTKIFGLS
jgi:hypothetical protein